MISKTFEWNRGFSFQSTTTGGAFRSSLLIFFLFRSAFWKLTQGYDLFPRAVVRVRGDH
jgi:hypothetical protein